MAQGRAGGLWGSGRFGGWSWRAQPRARVRMWGWGDTGAGGAHGGLWGRDRKSRILGDGTGGPDSLRSPMEGGGAGRGWVWGVYRGNSLTEVPRGGGIVAGTMVGDEVDLTLPLLLLQAQLGPAVPERAAAAQQDQDGPEQPEPCGNGGAERGVTLT